MRELDYNDSGVKEKEKLAPLRSAGEQGCRGERGKGRKGEGKKKYLAILAPWRLNLFAFFVATFARD